MRWIKLFFISSLFTLFSCDLGKAELDSCLDVFNYPSILEYPAIGFCPELMDGSVDDEIEVGVYALEVSGVAGIHAQVSYDANKVQIVDVYSGDFFDRSQKPIFVYNDNGQGTLDIYTFFMSNEKTTGGTKQIMNKMIAVSRNDCKRILNFRLEIASDSGGLISEISV